MIIGILQCDTVLPQYQAEFGSYATMIIDLLQLVDANLQFNIYDVEQQQYPSTLDECDAYITTGSKASVYDTLPWIQSFADYIITLHQHQKKLIGICFGHQLIAQALGGKTQPAEVSWGVGVATTTLHAKQAWMQPKPTTNPNALSLIVSHKDQVTQLPPNTQLIAGHAFCPHAIFQIDHHILSMQGHPEFSKAYSRTMMQHRAQQLGNKTLHSGIESLNKPVDDTIMAQWMLHFLTDQTT